MRPNVLEGQYIEVHGRTLWVHRAGQGSPVVVFVPGGGGIGLDFAPAHQRITAHATAVLYDRAGTGLSEDTELPRTAAEVVDELRTLLSTLELSGPYILVGHSLGGVYVQRFAQLHPEEVGGLVLLDPAHEDFDDYMPEHLKITTRHGDMPDAPEPTEELLGLARDQIAGYVADWPEPLRKQVIAIHTSPDRVLTGFHEGLNLVDVLTELRDGGRRPPLPSPS